MKIELDNSNLGTEECLALSCNSSSSVNLEF